MTEDIAPVIAPPTTEEPATSTPVELPTTDAAPSQPAVTPTWRDELDKADPKEIVQHSRVAGIIGSHVQKAIEVERQRIAHDEGQRAARKAEEELQELAQNDPVTFAEKWLTDAQRRQMQDQLSNLRSSTRSEFATAVGRAFTDVPEWRELNEADHEALARAIIGKSEDEVIPLFNRHALDLVATKRAQRLLADWKAKDLEKERAAIHQEEAAKLLGGSEAPDMARPKGMPSGVNIKAMTDPEFNDYWDKYHKQ